MMIQEISLIPQRFIYLQQKIKLFFERAPLICPI